MTRVRAGIQALGLLALALIGSACGLADQVPLMIETVSTVEPVPTPLVTPTLLPQLQTPAVLSPSATEQTELDTWQLLRPGLERRYADLLTVEGAVQERIYILRLDPAFFDFDVAYRPGEPQRLTDWQRETGALIVMNGGYFTADNIATGLVIADGQPIGASYVGFGGMLAIRDGVPTIRSLSQQAYDPTEYLQAGLQSFPMLIRPGGQLGFPDEDGLPDRRTVIAQDRRGRILFVVASTGTLTLHQMSRYLAESDLDVVVALNLDGGASTGLQLAEPAEGVAPYSLLPIVITVHPKS